MSSNLRSRTKSKAQLQSPKASTTQSETTPPPGDNAEEKAKCAICLGDLQNRSYSNNCCHQFCFGCLLEWSKVKPECPLCKSSFTSIYHNIRSISDYDEYHVPPIIQSPPISMLNVPYLHHIHHLDEDIMLRSHRFHPYGPSAMAPTFPFHHHSLRNRAHQLNFRILEYVPFERRAEQPNPFRTGQTEYFGTSIGLHNNDPMSSSLIPNYQARRRIYDRNQWVIPLGRTLPEGSYMFPSIEYIQTHPTARSRITTWLHRELTVLLGLQMSMHEMSAVFEVIMNVLENYDIRSREFRELVVSYFGYKTRHFQHEFYHFVLSGMGLEEYDRNACYSANRSSVSTDPRDLSTPPVVTIEDSSDDDIQIGSRNDECILIPPNDDTNSSTGTTASNANVPSTMAAYSHLPELPWDLTMGTSMAELNQVLERQLRNYQQLNSNLSGSTSSSETRGRYHRDRQRRHHEMCERIPQRDRRLFGTERFRPFRISRPHGPEQSQRNREPEPTEVVNVDSVSSSALPNEDEIANDDDCVLLGVHPVVKKPPLAVITISDSEDENTDRSIEHKQVTSQCKNEVVEHPEVQVQDQFLEMCYHDQTKPSTAATSGAVFVHSSASSSSSPSSSPNSSTSSNPFPMSAYLINPVSLGYPPETVTSATRHVQSLSAPRRREQTTAVHPTSSRRLRLLDSKKPKSTRGKKAGKSNSRKHRISSSTSKRKRIRSPSSSSDDARVSRSRRVGGKKSNKRKKSKRAPSSSSSSISDTDSTDSCFSLSSFSSSNQSEWKKLKQHRKAFTSSNKSTSNDIPKLRKSHKSKKKSGKSSSKRNSRGQNLKKNLTLSREFISSSDSDSIKETPSAGDPVIIDSSGSSTAVCCNMGSTSSSSTILDNLCADPPSSLANTSYHQNALTSEVCRSDTRDFNEIIEAALHFDGLGDEIRNLVEAAASNVLNSQSEPNVNTINDMNNPEEGRNDSPEWELNPSTPPYLLNLSLSRMSDDFWS
ncbi:unnamed protein product [Allacma fusca]|uniref:E3 ubiquitin-protein ligase Topors n=1 Tax=Allacma fusca TaxID=39272 RepID=A0A8J2JML1_9HEXA|nr:unnamed protein product [Allacma fusca]